MALFELIRMFSLNNALAKIKNRKYQMIFTDNENIVDSKNNQF